MEIRDIMVTLGSIIVMYGMFSLVRDGFEDHLMSWFPLDGRANKWLEKHTRIRRVITTLVAITIVVLYTYWMINI